VKIRDVIRMIEADGWSRFASAAPIDSSSTPPSLGWSPSPASPETTLLRNPEQRAKRSRSEVKKYLVIVEPTANGFSAYFSASVSLIHLAAA
jgi:hypothetical protein